MESNKMKPEKYVSMNYGCQSGEDKDVFACLSKEEQMALRSIIYKMYKNGIKLRIIFTEGEVPASFTNHIEKHGWL